MQPLLISHSPDLSRLWDEGYALEIRPTSHLAVHHVPYLNGKKEIKYGTLVSTLNLASAEKTAKPETHVCYFIGEEPCDKDGNRLVAIINSNVATQLAPDLHVNITFSSRPSDGYADYFEKITTYVTILGSPVEAIDDSITAKIFKIYESQEIGTVFEYPDTNTARAEINTISEKLKGQRIALVGLGGTGTYILDFLAKTPVKEIHIFDRDWFLIHNAFRSPGAPSGHHFENRPKKVDYFKELYSKMHKGIKAHDVFVDKSNIHELAEMDFVFVAIDKGAVKRDIFEYLEREGIDFIDVGMGLQKVDDQLIGIVATITSTSNKRDHIWNGRVSFSDDGKNEYSKNIQIAELNSLNAALAIIKWKKCSGFYQDLEREHTTTYSINVNLLLSEDNQA